MSVHDGHRDRLRDRFREHGLDSFNDLNALELLLFYAIPRRDTNEIAHALLEHFGSLHAVFEASEQELCEVSGVGTQAATLIRLIPQMMRKNACSKTANIRTIRKSSEAGKYLIPRFLYEQDEVILLLCLDTHKRLITCVEVGRGVVNASETSIRRIVETALKHKSSSVILAHNHPDGEACPSVEDDMMTRQIYRSLSLVGVKLDDHIVVAGEKYASFRDMGMMSFF